MLLLFSELLVLSDKCKVENEDDYYCLYEGVYFMLMVFDCYGDWVEDKVNG